MIDIVVGSVFGCCSGDGEIVIDVILEDLVDVVFDVWGNFYIVICFGVCMVDFWGLIYYFVGYFGGLVGFVGDGGLSVDSRFYLS